MTHTKHQRFGGLLAYCVSLNLMTIENAATAIRCYADSQSTIYKTQQRMIREANSGYRLKANNGNK